MTKRTLGVICYVVVQTVVLTWGYLESFSDRWLLWFLAVWGIGLVVSYLVYLVTKRKKRKETSGG